MRAKDKGSMHRLNYLDEVVKIHTYIRENVLIEWREDNNQEPKFIKYTDFCGTFCNSANAVVDLFINDVHTQLNNLKLYKTINKSMELTYPIAKHYFWPIHLEHCFFGVRLNDSLNNSLNKVNSVTNIRHIEV